MGMGINWWEWQEMGMLRAIPAHLYLALQVLQQQSLIVVVLRAGGKESPVKVGIVVRQSIDGHGVEQFLPPVGGAVLDVRVRRQEHPHVVDAGHGSRGVMGARAVI